MYCCCYQHAVIIIVKYIISQNVKARLDPATSEAYFRTLQLERHPSLHLYQFAFGNTRVIAKREVQPFRVKSGRHNVRHLRKDGKRGR
jgi:hypothetical protein